MENELFTLDLLEILVIHLIFILFFVVYIIYTKSKKDKNEIKNLVEMEFSKLDGKLESINNSLNMLTLLMNAFSSRVHHLECVPEEPPLSKMLIKKDPPKRGRPRKIKEEKAL